MTRTKVFCLTLLTITLVGVAAAKVRSDRIQNPPHPPIQGEERFELQAIFGWQLTANDLQSLAEAADSAGCHAEEAAAIVLFPAGGRYYHNHSASGATLFSEMVCRHDREVVLACFGAHPVERNHLLHLAAGRDSLKMVRQLSKADHVLWE